MKIGLFLAFVFLASGASLAQTPVPQPPPLVSQDAVLLDYLHHLANAIATRTNRKTTFTIEVLESDSVNAFAQPNGEVYLTRGLLQAVDNEAELVFVLAQQLSYLQPRPPIPVAMKKPSAGHTLLIGLLSGAMIVAGGPAGVRLGALILAGEINHRASPRPVYASSATLLPEVVLSADQFALGYLHEAGYDPEAALSLLTKLRALRPRGYLQQSQLPSPPVTFQERLRVARRQLAKLERKAEVMLDSSAFQALKKRLALSPTRPSSSPAR